MKKLTYEEPQKHTQAEIEEMLKSGNSRTIQSALLSLSLNGHDWKSLQDICLGYLTDLDVETVDIAVLCLGHIARIHRRLEKKKVIEALQKLAKRQELSGRVEAAISDINIFIKE